MWQIASLGNAAGCLRAMANEGLLNVEPVENKYIQKYEGGVKVVRSLLNEIQDRNFLNKLDLNIPKGCVAMADGM